MDDIKKKLPEGAYPFTMDDDCYCEPWKKNPENKPYEFNPKDYLKFKKTPPSDETYGLDEPLFNLFGYSITEGQEPVSERPIHPQKYISIVQNCALMCANFVHRLTGSMRKRQIDQLMACADVCNLQAKLAVTNSVFAKDSALLCAQVCEITSITCKDYEDSLSQHAAKKISECAKACRNFANSL